jgi:hypothetical protein
MLDESHFFLWDRKYRLFPVTWAVERTDCITAIEWPQNLEWRFGTTFNILISAFVYDSNFSAI